MPLYREKSKYPSDVFEDILDSSDFNPIQFINQKFPTETSLDLLDTFLTGISSQISSLDEEISKAVQAQSKAGEQATRVLFLCNALVFVCLVTIFPSRISRKPKCQLESCLIKYMISKLRRRNLREWCKKYALVIKIYINSSLAS